MTVSVRNTSVLGQSLPDVALLVVGVLATIVLAALPVLVAGMADRHALDNREIGWLAAADMAGGAIASLAVLRYMARVAWRRLVLAAISVVIGANLLAIAANEFTMLLAVRTVAGAANGIVLSVCFTGLCHSHNPDRYFGGYTFTQLLLQAGSLAVLPGLLASHGIGIVYLLLAGVSAASALLVPWIPRDLGTLQRRGEAAARDPRALSTSTRTTRATNAGGHIALFGQAVYFLAPAAIWGYFEPIGRGFGLDMSQVGQSLAIAAFAGMAGAIVVMVLGARVGRLRPMMVGNALSVAALLLLMVPGTAVQYLVAGSVFNFAWNFTFPYQMGVLSQFDRAGAMAVASLVVQLCGLAAGPLLASFLVGDAGFGPILYACVTCHVASVLLFRRAAAMSPARIGDDVAITRTHA